MANLKRTLHFADYELAAAAIPEITTEFKVVLTTEKSPEDGLLLTYELDSEDFNDFIEIIEGFGLQVY
ncbi:MAG: hypothetical protein PHQ74_08105 [Crocinitomicaceae bacterium]|nr:hypothetical protein [Crocinitomicaceae bacterium]